MPTAFEYLYTTATDVRTLLSAEGVDASLDDDQSGTVSETEETRLTTYAANYATSKVNDYCLGRYDAIDLASSWTANEWATIIAARWVRLRRGNPVPKSLQELFEDVMEDLKAVRTKQYDIQDLAERVSSAPKWSNVRVDVRYRLRQIRVQRPISEQTPPRIPPVSDLAATLTGPEI